MKMKIDMCLETAAEPLRRRGINKALLISDPARRTNVKELTFIAQRAPYGRLLLQMHIGVDLEMLLPLEPPVADHALVRPYLWLWLRSSHF